MPTIYVSQTASTSGGITFGVGSDSNTYVQAQSPLTPLLTLDTAVNGALAKAVTGDTIIINDGTYTAGTFFSITNKNLTINPATAGQVVFKRTGAQTRVLNIDNSAGTTTLGALVIDAENNSGTGGITVASVASLTTITLNGTIIRNVTGIAGFGSNSALIGVTMNGVNIQVTDGACVRSTTGMTASSYYVIQHDSYLNSSCTNTVMETVRISSTATGAYAIVRDSTVLHSNTASTICGCIGIYNTRHLVERNRLFASGTATATSLYRNGSLAAVAAENSICRWNYGVSTVTGTGGYLFVIGADATGGANDNQVNYPGVYGNFLVGSAPATVQHGIFMGFMNGGVVTGNVVLRSAIPYISKGQSERSYWVNNVADKGTASTSGMLRSKGSVKATFYGNSVRSDSTSQNPVVLINADGATNSTGADVFGNTFKVAWTATTINNVAVSSDAEFGFNDYDIDGVSGTPFAYTASTYATLALWIAGQELTGTSLPVGVKDKNFWNKLLNASGPGTLPPSGIMPPWGQ